MIKTKKFGVFEKSFSASDDFNNPYKEIETYARLQPPNGNNWLIPLFYDGDNTWKLRVSPDKIGIWNYYVDSNDPELNGISGKFKCIDSSLKGGLDTMKGYPMHFQYQNGNPVWFFGDTQWRLFATEAENKLNRESVEHYIDVRSGQGFNYIHTDLMGGAGISSGEHIFESFSEEIINEEFFQEVDYRIKYMNDKGITSGIVLAWHRGNPAWESFKSEEACLRYARYIVARYSAYNTVFIISGEWDQINMDKKPLFNKIGQEIMTYDPHNRLRAIHPCKKRTVEEFAIEPWMSFGDYQQMYKAPHDREASAEERKALHDALEKTKKYNKPVLNTEYGYYLRKMGGNQDYRQNVKDIDKPHSHTRQSFRRASWSLIMTGGYFVTGFGTTYFGGWRNIGPFDVDDPKNDDAEQDLMNIKNFFTRLKWWELEVKDTLVKGDKDNPCYCLTNKETTYVIYSEENNIFNLNINQDDAKDVSVKRYNPRTGDFKEITDYSLVGNSLEITNPDTQDWVYWISN
ncbi:MAG: DUF4038 domain-containing protein [Halanaerobiales bacterium]